MLTVAKFDLDETLPVANVPRPKSASGVLPAGFHYLVDDESGEVIAPVLIHLATKYSGPAAFRKGRWTKQLSTRDAAADLKAWWIYCEIRERSWQDADDRLLADYIVALRTVTSLDTDDYLSDSTIRRRLSTIAEFYRFAEARWALGGCPKLSNAQMLAKPRSPRRGILAPADSDPHPIADDHVEILGEQMGTLPSQRPSGSRDSSKERLAFDLALMVGLRIDELLKLNVGDFEALQVDNADDNRVFTLRIERTKGLRPRTIYIPAYLVREIQLYIEGERREALAVARRHWFTSDQPTPVTLLLNSPTAAANAGKALRAATIEEKFNRIQRDLDIVRRHLIRRDQPDQAIEIRPRYVFHDCRHTFALWSYQSQRQATANGQFTDNDPISFVQRRLGHAHRATTVDIYLNVFSELATQGLEAHVADMTRRRFRREEERMQ